MSGQWDGHAHVFSPELPFVEPRRYTPAYAATADQFIGHLNASGLAGGLLTQPSFLGTDNSHMLAAVARYPNRLRAVVMVDPGVSDVELDALGAQGAVGVRLNLEGLALPDLTRPPWPALFERLARRNWHVEIHRKAVDLPVLLAPLLASGVRICIDHFGRPDPQQGADDPGFQALLRAAASGRVWVKVSAAYRTGGVERGEVLAPTLLAALLTAVDASRLIWASDWPHTQHESQVTHRDCFEALERWAGSAVLASRLRTEGLVSLLNGV